MMVGVTLHKPVPPNKEPDGIFRVGVALFVTALGTAHNKFEARPPS